MALIVKDSFERVIAFVLAPGLSVAELPDGVSYILRDVAVKVDLTA